MKKHIYYPPEDIKDVASIYESEINGDKIYVYRKVPIEEILNYYLGKKSKEIDEEGRIFLFTKNSNKEVEMTISSYWEDIRQLFREA